MALEGEIRKIKNKDVEEVRHLIWETFLHYEAPDYSEEGIATFKSLITNKDFFENLNIIGYFEELLLGVIVTDNQRSHIMCFFVEQSHQGKGIGKKLWEFVKKESVIKSFTVNSSPYAKSIYNHLGFIEKAAEQTIDGIRFIPMYYEEREGGDR